jgi:hypothetical protein
VADPSSIFAASTYNVNALSLATAVASLAIAALGAAVLARGRTLAAGRAFFLVSAAYAGWLFCWAAMYACRASSDALGWARTGFLFAALIAPALFQFATNYAASRRRYRPFVAVCWVVCGAARCARSTGATTR